MAVDSSIQRIARLTPLGDVLALVERRVGAVSPRRCALAAALGRVLAEDVAVPQLPPRPIALRDGFAVEAAAIADAGAYAPVPLPIRSRRIDAGEPLPEGADAVLPLDAVALRGDRAEAVGSIAPGEGMLMAGGDASAQTPLRRAGEKLRNLDVAVMAAAGVTEVTVREPRILLACGSAAKTTPPLDAALAMLARTAAAAGAAGATAACSLDEALADLDADAVIGIGGTGSGRRDGSVRALAQLGHVEAHGIAVSPGETAAFGLCGARPVLLVPGRLDAALAIWLLLGRHLVARLAGGSVEDAPAMLPLARKVASTIGLVELIPVRCAGAMAEPLASGYLSFTSLARSDGWIVIPADSEGFGAATPVAVRPWP